MAYGVMMEQPQEISITATQSKSLPMKFGGYKEVLNLFFSCSAVMKAKDRGKPGMVGGFSVAGRVGKY